MVKEWMKWDEAGTIEDLKYVFDNFTMPGNSQIPGYDAAAKVLGQNRHLRAARIYQAGQKPDSGRFAH